MFVAFHKKTTASVSAVSAPTVNDATYQPALQYVLTPVFAKGGLANQSTVDVALAALLQLRVPADEQQTHLAFAMALSQLSAGLKGDKAALQTGQSEWQAAVAAYPWVH